MNYNVVTNDDKNVYILVYTTQENSTFGASWLASSVTSEQPKRNKMASRFATVTYGGIYLINEAAVKKKYINGNKVWFDGIKW